MNVTKYFKLSYIMIFVHYLRNVNYRLDAIDWKETLMKTLKTNAMRLLEKAGIQYTLHDFLPLKEGEELGYDAIAARVGRPRETIFKTILCQGASKKYCVLVIQGTESLDFKKAARVLQEKSIALVDVAELEKITGYVRGGCSPVGMKKPFATVLDERALTFSTILISAGRRGYQLEVAPQDLIRLTGALTADLKGEPGSIY